MSEVDPDMFDDFEDLTTKAKRRERVRSGKRKKPGPTASGRVQHAAEIRAARDQRRKEALEKIQSRLLERHFSSETPEEENRLRRYVRWVEESLAQGFPFVKEEDIEFKGTIASVKAGGQHRQKKRTAVRATGTLTGISNFGKRWSAVQAPPSISERPLWNSSQQTRKKVFIKEPMPGDKYTAVWVSHSSITDFVNCPRAYFLNNIYRDPVTGHKITVISPPLALGQAIHEVIETLSHLPSEKRFREPLAMRFDHV